MKSKTMVLVVVALVCGLGAAYMTSRLIAERNETVTVLVAKQKFGPWTLIKDPAAMFAQQEVPKGEAPKSAVLNLEDLKDRVLLRTLPTGQTVVMEDLQDKNKNSMETQLTPGMFAIDIKTDASSAVGGFVLPGSHVDVYHHSDHGGGPAELVLQNILVRAVDLTNVRPDDKPGLVPTTVTLEVTREQALQIVQIKDSGTITLALRASGDTSVIPLVKLKNAAKPKVVVKKDEPRMPTSVRHQLEIWNGDQLKTAMFSTVGGVTTVKIVDGLDPEASAKAAATAAESGKMPARAPGPRASGSGPGTTKNSVSGAEAAKNPA